MPASCMLAEKANNTVATTPCEVEEPKRLFEEVCPLGVHAERGLFCSVAVLTCFQSEASISTSSLMPFFFLILVMTLW